MIASSCHNPSWAASTTNATKITVYLLSVLVWVAKAMSLAKTAMLTNSPADSDSHSSWFSVNTSYPHHHLFQNNTELPLSLSLHTWDFSPFPSRRLHKPWEIANIIRNNHTRCKFLLGLLQNNQVGPCGNCSW